jgi:hypothetical protein
LQEHFEQAVFVRLSTIQTYVDPQPIGEQMSLCRAQPPSHCSDHLLERGYVRLSFGMSCARDYPSQAHCYIPDDKVSVLYVTRRHDLRRQSPPGQSPSRNAGSRSRLYEHDEARRIAANITELPELLKRPQYQAPG